MVDEWRMVDVYIVCGCQLSFIIVYKLLSLVDWWLQLTIVCYLHHFIVPDVHFVYKFKMKENKMKENKIKSLQKPSFCIKIPKCFAINNLKLAHFSFLRWAHGVCRAFLKEFDKRNKCCTFNKSTTSLFFSDAWTLIAYNSRFIWHFFFCFNNF